MAEREAKFQVGEVVQHKLFDYLGVVFDVDPIFSGTEEWYQQMARSRPPKDEPWYHVLVDGAGHTTYVAERNIEPAAEPRPIAHALADHYFSGFDGQRYLDRRRAN